MGTPGGRQMGLWMTSALVVGTMIGAGIFMLPVSLAPTGANAPLAWLLSGLGAVCIAYALGRLSQLGGEGIQANIERKLGKVTAFLVAWAFWVSNWAAQAAVAIAGASALSWVDPRFSGPGFVIPVALGGVVVCTGVNAMGVRAAGSMSLVTVAIRLIPLFAVIAIAVQRGAQTGHFEPLAPMPITPVNLAGAVALTFYALTGFENATTPVGKVHDPARTIPRAIVGGTLFVAALYLMASTAVQLLEPASVVAASPAPLADVIAARWGATAATLAALAIAVAAFGCLNGLILSTGELGYAMGLRGDLPRFMAWTRHDGTPVGAQLCASALSIALIAANTSRTGASLFTFIVLLATAAMLVVYLAGALVAWALTPTPTGRATIVVAIAFVGFATYGAGADADLWCLVLLVIGFGVYATVHRARLIRKIAGQAA